MKDNDDSEPSFKDIMSEVNIQNENNLCIDFCETDKTYNKHKSTNNELSDSTFKTRRSAAEGSDKKSSDYYVSEFAVKSIDAYENVEFNLWSLNNKEKRRLRYCTTAYVLDLHGFTIENARDELNDFIKFAIENKIKYITVIHGSSTSSKNHKDTLKSFCVHWLERITDVKAFCSSMTKHSNAPKVNFGSINVLLSK